MSRYLIIVLAALALAPAALADGYAPWAQQNGDGVLGPTGRNGPVRYVALGSYGGQTMLARIETRTGFVESSVPLLGSWGIPIFTYGQNTGEGLSHDGRTLVLADLAATLPRTISKFMFVKPATLRVVGGAVLKGDFSYDALSPDGKHLYLIQHRNVLDQTHYVVREYDIAAQRLLPGRVADRTQKSWVMNGYPIARTSTADGRWVYTLYGQPNGYPFVHALDTVRGVAHCVGLPWRGGVNAVYNMRLTLHGRSLAVHWLSGRPWYRVDTTTWRLSPDHRGAFPWWTLAFLALVPAGLVGRRMIEHSGDTPVDQGVGGGAQRRRDPGRLQHRLRARPHGRLAAAAQQGGGRSRVRAG